MPRRPSFSINDPEELLELHLAFLKARFGVPGADTGLQKSELAGQLHSRLFDFLIEREHKKKAPYPPISPRRSIQLDDRTKQPTWQESRQIDNQPDCLNAVRKYLCDIDSDEWFNFDRNGKLALIRRLLRPFNYDDKLLYSLLHFANSEHNEKDYLPETPTSAHHTGKPFKLGQWLTKHRRQTLPFTRLAIEGRGCYGECPVFRAELFSDGRARFTGEYFVSRIGRFCGQVPLFDFATLCACIEQIKIAEMRDEYSLLATDGEQRYYEVEGPTFLKTINDYFHQGPHELHEYWKLFTMILSRIDWQQDNTE